ncbi:MFS transporter [Pseudomonas monteilii]|uniref:MFS transporter n=1 Tax=Pseudomonas monteilii TaxID=76759 RepID=A0AAE6RC10_9PSED|nr:MFS transporter [Pseudomonas monteilii]
MMPGSCLLLPWIPSFGGVALTQTVCAIAGSLFAPAIAAISLGIAGPEAFTPPQAS